MSKLKLRAPAKINLTLDILRKRHDGYHEVRMVMQAISLFDYISLRDLPEDCISLRCNIPGLPVDERNIMWKAARLVKNRLKVRRGVEMVLAKHIPIAAGLAGGSTDGAAVLKGLNRLWELNLSDGELLSLAAELGSDVPFCLMGGTGLATGRGEIVEPLNIHPELNLVLIKPPFDVSTKEVYQNFSLEKTTHHPDDEEIIRALQARDLPRIVSAMGNVLETVTLRLYPVLEKVKEELLLCGAKGVLMSGSGPTIFGLFETEETAGEAITRLKKLYPNHAVLFAKAYESGVEFQDLSSNERSIEGA